MAVDRQDVLADGSLTARASGVAMKPPAQAVTIREVGLRDGLQSLARIVPTEHKLAWIRDAYAAGVRAIEV